MSVPQDTSEQQVTAKRKTKQTAPWEARFFRELRKHGTIYRACQAAGVNRSNIYQRRDADPAFATAMQEAIEDSTDELEREAVRRGKEGVLEPCVYRGRIMGDWVDAEGKPCDRGAEGSRFIPCAVRKYSDALMGKLLQWRRYPTHVELTGPGGAAIAVNWDLLFTARPIDTTSPLSQPPIQLSAVTDQTLSGSPTPQIAHDAILDTPTDETTSESP